jgi:hypothetical protein
MWPWGHLAFGYVLYSVVTRVTRGRSPEWPAVALLALGTQMPDLVDKPLAWTFGILPSGRSLAHSLLFGTLFVVVVAVGLRRLSLPGADAFAIGYFSHIAGDSIRPLLAGNFADLTFLFYPVLPVPEGTPSVGILSYVLNADLSGGLLFEIGMAAAVMLLWLLDGAPGVVELSQALWRRFRRLPN